MESKGCRFWWEDEVEEAKDNPAYEHLKYLSSKANPIGQVMLKSTLEEYPDSMEKLYRDNLHLKSEFKIGYFLPLNY